MPLMHILINLLSYYPLHHGDLLKKLADEIDELRMLNMPYGMLVNELCIMLD